MHHGSSNHPNAVGRSSSLVSISEAARLASAKSNIKRRRVSATTDMAVPRSELPAQSTSSSRLQICQTSTPLTPSLDAGTMSDSGDASVRRRQTVPKRVSSQSTTNTPVSHNRTLSKPALTHAEDTDVLSFDMAEEDSTERTPDAFGPSSSRTSYMNEGPTHTGHIDSDSSASGLALATPSSRPRPAALDTTAAQDISLPSPRLSPVIALANRESRRSYFEDGISRKSVGSLALSSPPHGSTDEDDTVDADISMAGYWPEEQRIAPESQSDLSNQPNSQYTMLEMPAMLDSFQAMPVEMKAYLMYQFLRRCPKKVLHFVAETVNPALKCDFLSLLPPELCQSIIGHLDVRSLCRAAQVSKKWREVIDTDEKTWKSLFDNQGFNLPAEELERAIWEGWGWQYSSRGDDWDEDISGQELLATNDNRTTSPVKADPTATCSPSSDQQVQSTQMKRSKRKAPPKSKSSGRKQQKRKESDSAGLAQFDRQGFIKNASIADGPYAAAKAAGIAVRNCNVGLSSLRQLHLYKSIYRRHHLISSNWMQDEIKPRHLAFKAHQRHVVTCLQFDADKILTGSDDTNINVYDTKTGALRASLEGHEGGVWALQYEGNVLVSGSTDRSVRVWDIERGACTHIFQGHTSTVRCLVILMPTIIDTAPDGQPIMMPKEPLIITGSRDSNLRVWKLPENGSPFMQAGPSQDETECPYFVRALTGHHHSVRAIAAHGDTLVSGSYDCTVRVWKISTGETVYRLQGHTQKVYSVVLDHGRNRCISGSMDTLVKVWSLETGSLLYNLEGHSSLVGLLDLQRDRLVSAAADSTLRVWEPKTGLCKSVLSAHTGAITCFQHDGQKVISGSDRTLKMWNIRSGSFVRDLLTDLSGVWQVKFDERRCVAAVQRNNLTYIEVSVILLTASYYAKSNQVLDYGAPVDGVPESKRGRRIVVDTNGLELNESTEQRDAAIDLDGVNE